MPARSHSLRSHPGIANSAASDGFMLVPTSSRLELHEAGSAGSARTRPLYVDFAAGRLAQRRITGQSRRQPLARAIGLRGPALRVVDATAGLAQDAFLMAVLGCRVVAVERSPVLAALVQDALDRGANAGSPALRRVLDRIDLLSGDSRDVLRTMRSSHDLPDVVYLDPMYEPAERSALAKKEMRIVRRLVGNDEDAEELFREAILTARTRVVVKRHPHAPPLAPDPPVVVRGRTVRYDVYFLLPAPTGSGSATSKSSSSAAS